MNNVYIIFIGYTLIFLSFIFIVTDLFTIIIAYINNKFKKGALVNNIFIISPALIGLLMMLIYSPDINKTNSIFNNIYFSFAYLLLIVTLFTGLAYLFYDYIIKIRKKSKILEIILLLSPGIIGFILLIFKYFIIKL